MNILCIGNSFSQDSTRYLHQVSDDTLYVRNLYIGGCSLETHYKNILEDRADYEYQKNGRCMRMISIKEALTKRKWDYVTVQQVSQLSGVIESYEPYITEVINYVKSLCPKAKIVFHRTWAYDTNSTHGGFDIYSRSRKLMYEKIIEATNEICKKHSLEIIPCGDAVEKARELPEFCDGASLNLNRDGFHLSLDYGRYLAALVMYRFFTGNSAQDVKFEPEETDSQIIAKLKAIADSVF